MRGSRFAASALATLAVAARSADPPVTLILHPGEKPSDLQSRLEATAEEVEAGTEGAITRCHSPCPPPPARPALTIAAGPRAVIHYLAEPEGAEAFPFIETLAALAGGNPRGGRARREMRRLQQPASVMVFVSPGCPNCPHAVRAALQLAVATELLEVSVVDASHFTDLAEGFRIRSVPTTIIDGELAEVGVLPARKLADRLLTLGSDEHRRRVFTSMVDGGRFADAAASLADGRTAQHFVELWRNSTLERRIALRLTADAALAANPRTLDPLVPGLLPALTAEAAALRGDTADLLGAIGDPSALKSLETLRSDPDPDVAEAAADAIAEIPSVPQPSSASDSHGQ